MVKVFVYGTLKPGESNYQEYCGDRVLSAIPAWVTGKLFALPLGYPALYWDQTADWVQGYLLTFATTEALQGLDQLEEYQEHRPPQENTYQRRTVEVFAQAVSVSQTQVNQEFDQSLAQPIVQGVAHPFSLGMAWVYVMELEQIHQWGGIFLTKGYWTSDLSKG